MMAQWASEPDTAEVDSPTEAGGGKGILLLLSSHSHAGKQHFPQSLKRMAGTTGLEPAASAVTGGVFAVTARNFSAPIAALGALSHPQEVLLMHTLIAPRFS
jgi:hypothetical protein